MAVNEAGITLVNLGSPQIISMVNKTNPKSMYKFVPVSQFPEASLKISNCDMKMTIANPVNKSKYYRMRNQTDEFSQF